MLSHLIITETTIWSSLVIYQPDLEYTTFAWLIKPFDIHWWMIMCQNSVLEMHKRLTGDTIGTIIVFQRNMSSKLTLWLSISPATQETSPFFHPNLISGRYVARDTVCISQTLQVEQSSILWLVMNWMPLWVGVMLYIGMTVASWNPASIDYFVVDNSIAAFAIVHGWYHESTYALKKLLARLWL